MDKPKHFVDPYVEKLKMEERKTQTKQEFIPSTQAMLTKSGDAMLTSDDSFDQSGKSTHILHVINSERKCSCHLLLWFLQRPIT